MELIQVTLFDKNGRYRPVSTIYKVESIEWFNAHREEAKVNAVIKICQQRGWTQKELEKYGYKTCKIRRYDPEQIKKEAQERYEKIKQERGWS